MNMTFKATMMREWTITDDSILIGGETVPISSITIVQPFSEPSGSLQNGVIQIWVGGKFYTLAIPYSELENGREAYRYLLHKTGNDAAQPSSRASVLFRKKVQAYMGNGEKITEAQEAALFAQRVEQQTLKAPTTAVFPPLEEVSVIGGDGQYTVTGFVDSQNSYGAMIRSNYSLHVRKEDGEWKCIDTFVDSATQIRRDVNTQVAKSTAIYWVLGLIGTIITYFIIRAAIGF